MTMTIEQRLDRLEKTLGTLIIWSSSLNDEAKKQLLEMLQAITLVRRPDENKL